MYLDCQSDSPLQSQVNPSDLLGEHMEDWGRGCFREDIYLDMHPAFRDEICEHTQIRKHALVARPTCIAGLLMEA